MAPNRIPNCGIPNWETGGRGRDRDAAAGGVGSDERYFRDVCKNDGKTESRQKPHNQNMPKNTANKNITLQWRRLAAPISSVLTCSQTGEHRCVDIFSHLIARTRQLNEFWLFIFGKSMHAIVITGTLVVYVGCISHSLNTEHVATIHCLS